MLPPQILIYHPAFIKYVLDSWLQGHGRYPSTGILSVIFSLHICDEVRPSPGIPAGQARHQGPSFTVPEKPCERLWLAVLDPDPSPCESVCGWLTLIQTQAPGGLAGLSQGCFKEERWFPRTFPGARSGSFCVSSPGRARTRGWKRRFGGETKEPLA